MRLQLDEPVEEFGQTWTHWEIVCVQLHTPIDGVKSVIFEYCLANSTLVWPEVFRISSNELDEEIKKGNSFKAFQQATFAALKSLALRVERQKARM